MLIINSTQINQINKEKRYRLFGNDHTINHVTENLFSRECVKLLRKYRNVEFESNSLFELLVLLGYNAVEDPLYPWLSKILIELPFNELDDFLFSLHQRIFDELYGQQAFHFIEAIDKIINNYDITFKYIQKGNFTCLKEIWPMKYEYIQKSDLQLTEYVPSSIKNRLSSVDTINLYTGISFFLGFSFHSDPRYTTLLKMMENSDIKSELLIQLNRYHLELTKFHN